MDMIKLTGTFLSYTNIPKTFCLPKFKRKKFCLNTACSELPVTFKNIYFYDATLCFKYHYINKWLIHLMKKAECNRVPHRECGGNKIAHHPARKGPERI
jgi:hypothetical protein